MGYGAGGFGSVPHGSTTVGSLTVTYNLVTVPQDGGIQVTLGGLYNGDYIVRFGPNLDDTDSVCFWIPGRGNVTTISDTTATVWIPPSPVGTAGFSFERVSGGGAAAYDTGLVITVVPFPFRRRMLSLRALFPAIWDVGYHTTSDENLQA